MLNEASERERTTARSRSRFQRNTEHSKGTNVWIVWKVHNSSSRSSSSIAAAVAAAYAATKAPDEENGPSSEEKEVHSSDRDRQKHDRGIKRDRARERERRRGGV